MAGSPFAVTVTAIDNWGNTATSYTGNQTLSFSGAGTSPGGNAPSYPTNGVVAFSAGVGTATMTLYNASATTNVTATQGSLSNHRQLHGQSDRPCGYRPDECHYEPDACCQLQRHHRLGHLYVPFCE